MDSDYLIDLFEPFGAVTPKRMFGGLGVYHDGLMFALVADGVLFLKVDDETIPLFEAAGSRPFVYQGKAKPVQMSYWTTPEDSVDDPDALKIWADRAYAAALRGKKKT